MRAVLDTPLLLASAAVALAIAIGFALRRFIHARRRRDYLVQEIPDFLSAEECDRIIELARPLIQGSTVLKEGERKAGTIVRTSQSAFLKDVKDATVRKVQQRCAELTHTDIRCQESLQVTHYEQGQYYTKHFDALASGGQDLGEAGDRYCTVIIYLNDDCKGGATRFYKIGARVKPERGKAVFFRNLTADESTHHPHSLHGAEPILQGEKWLVNQWIRLRPLPGARNRKARRARARR